MRMFLCANRQQTSNLRVRRRHAHFMSEIHPWRALPQHEQQQLQSATITKVVLGPRFLNNYKHTSLGRDAALMLLQHKGVIGGYGTKALLVLRHQRMYC
jgi:hypothetical protein